MVCDDNARLLHGYLDGELDLVRSLEIEEHLKGCPDCAQAIWNQQTLRKAFRSSSLYERAPAGLAERVRASIAKESSRGTHVAESAPQVDAVAAEAPPAVLQKEPIAFPSSKRVIWNWMAVAAAVLLAFVITWRMLPGSVGRGIFRSAGAGDCFEPHSFASTGSFV